MRIFTGREFVGIPGIQGMFVYKFAWNKFWRKPAPTGEEMPEYSVQAHEQENVYITPFEAQYPLMYGGIEVLDSQPTTTQKNQKPALIPITFTITVRVRMLKPKIALMQNVDWFGQVLAPYIQKSVKEFAGKKNYDQIIRDDKGKVSKDFRNLFLPQGGSLNRIQKQILDDAGVEITDIEITDIKPNQVFEDALLAQAVAERTARAKIAEAEGAKQVKILAGEAEKEYLSLVGEGKAAATLAQIEADMARIEKTILKTAGGPGAAAAELEKWHKMQDSKLTAYFGGGSNATPSIIIGATGQPLVP